MTKYFGITYSLAYSNGTLFEPLKKSYVANIVAETVESAIDKLKEMFNMLTVTVIGSPDCYEISNEEYNAES